LFATSIHSISNAEGRGELMSDWEITTHDRSERSAEERRSQRSAREVTEWEAALAGGMGSRAHRAEKTTVRPPEP
jgi:hypothetical protein